MSLFLIGMRGSGKTTTGQIVAEQLGVCFIDTDRLIEEQTGHTIAQIFISQGEAAFRLIEKNLMLQLLSQQETVIATGGGCILDSAVREGLSQTGRTVWLNAPLSVLKQRIRGSNRPSLTGVNIEEELSRLANEREALYRACAATCIDTGSLTPLEVAHVLQQLWSILPHHHLR